MIPLGFCNSIITFYLLWGWERGSHEDVFPRELINLDLERNSAPKSSICISKIKLVIPLDAMFRRNSQLKSCEFNRRPLQAEHHAILPSQ